MNKPQVKHYPAHGSGFIAYYDVAEMGAYLKELEAEVSRLRAERNEQLSILEYVGPITCRNGVKHHRIDECVYCVIDALRTRSVIVDAQDVKLPKLAGKLGGGQVTPEGALQKTIMDWLTAKRILAFRMNTGAAKTDARFFRFGVPGMADILALPHKWRKCLGCARDRLHLEPIWIEVKAPAGRQSELQKSFQQQVEAEGHLYILARDLDVVIEATGR